MTPHRYQIPHLSSLPPSLSRGRHTLCRAGSTTKLEAPWRLCPSAALVKLCPGRRRQELRAAIEGRVSVDGIGDGLLPTTTVRPFCRIAVDGALVHERRAYYVLLNKPAGVVLATRDAAAVCAVDILARCGRPTDSSTRAADLVAWRGELCIAGRPLDDGAAPADKRRPLREEGDGWRRVSGEGVPRGHSSSDRRPGRNVAVMPRNLGVVSARSRVWCVRCRRSGGRLCRRALPAGQPKDLSAGEAVAGGGRGGRGCGPHVPRHSV